MNDDYHYSIDDWKAIANKYYGDYEYFKWGDNQFTNEEYAKKAARRKRMNNPTKKSDAQEAFHLEEEEPTENIDCSHYNKPIMELF